MLVVVMVMMKVIVMVEARQESVLYLREVVCKLPPECKGTWHTAVPVDKKKLR